MNDLLQKIEETSAYLKSKIKTSPQAGVILGSGLGNFSTEVDIDCEIPYDEIPHFPKSTVEGHCGQLIIGEMGGKNIMAMAGRLHYYEGYSMQQITFPLRIMKSLGIKTLLISNAAGGLDPQYKVGDLMIIEDHINLQPEHPLRGKNEETLGVRFPDMSEPYDQSLINMMQQIAAANNILLRKGVYVGVQGPTFETRAEYRHLRIIGGDAVGMSTVPEAIVAAHAGIKTFAMSVITDIGVPEELNVISHEEVLAAAASAEPILTFLFKELIRAL